MRIRKHRKAWRENCYGNRRRAKESCRQHADEFKPYYLLSEQADAMTVYLKPDADYSKRLCDHVTLLLSLDTPEIVGCRIKGIRDILQDLPNYIKVSHEGVKLSAVFLPFRGCVKNQEKPAGFGQQRPRRVSDEELLIPQLIVETTYPTRQSSQF